MMENKMEWISVEDRLPEDRGSILIFTKKGGYSVYYYPGHRERFYTHWIELPEPPKPKEPTFKDVFLEKFPKAVCDESGIPTSCAREIFGVSPVYSDDCYASNCASCWILPYFEEEGEQE